MPIYKYTTKDIEGKSHKGEVEVSDESHAASLLRKKGLVVISLKKKEAEQKKFWEKFLNQVSFSDVVVMTRQLATMIEAGLVLSESLDILTEQQDNPKFKMILEKISGDIKGGLDFATSLEKFPEVFPPLYSKLVRAGQASGKLDVVLLQLATTLEKDRDFQSKVKGAMIYPIVVMGMMGVVMLIMIFFVMPKLLSLYKDSGAELPLPTQIVIGITNFMLGYWWVLVLLIAGAIISFQKFISTANGRLAFDQLILKMPIVGKIANLVALTNFTRTFALLSASGISILEAIRIVADIMGNMVYKNALDLSYKGVERGLSFSSQLDSVKVFPRIVGQMIKTGEETGKLDNIMTRLADYFETEADNNLKNITTLIEPIIIVVLGIGVAFMVISIILPIYQLTTNIK